MAEHKSGRMVWRVVMGNLTASAKTARSAKQGGHQGWLGSSEGQCHWQEELLQRCGVCLGKLYVSRKLSISF